MLSPDGFCQSPICLFTGFKRRLYRGIIQIDYGRSYILRFRHALSAIRKKIRRFITFLILALLGEGFLLLYL